MSILGGIRSRMTKCLHCYKSISQLASGTWVDQDGFPYCMKTGGEIASVTSRALRHTPMPVIK